MTYYMDDEGLSWRARGLLAFLIDMIPSDAYPAPGRPLTATVLFSIREVAAQATEGVDAVRTALAELERSGYVDPDEQVRDDHGQLGPHAWIVRADNASQPPSTPTPHQP
jgi:hypothetical protein